MCGRGLVPLGQDLVGEVPGGGTGAPVQPASTGPRALLARSPRAAALHPRLVKDQHLPLAA